MLSEAVGLTLFPGIMAFAAASDLLTMTIANRLSILLIAGFVVLATLCGMTGAALITHLGAGAAVLVAAFVCFAHRWVGGGDAKLASAPALWLGFGHLLDDLLYASLLGGALAPRRRRRSLRYSARCRRAVCLSANRLDNAPWRLSGVPSDHTEA